MIQVSRRVWRRRLLQTTKRKCTQLRPESIEGSSRNVNVSQNDFQKQEFTYDFASGTSGLMTGNDIVPNKTLAYRSTGAIRTRAGSTE